MECPSDIRNFCLMGHCILAMRERDLLVCQKVYDDFHPRNIRMDVARGGGRSGTLET
ncbi:MAG: hypothetical protein ABI383_14970 [Acidobacteriaceae bacterium]